MALGTLIIFAVLGLVVAGSAIGMLVSRNAIYAALFLVLNFIAVGVLYLILGAPFISFAQVAIYAGSIMVLFVFVIMLLGAEQLPVQEPLRGQRWIGLLAGVLFLLEAGAFFYLRTSAPQWAAEIGFGFESPVVVGRMLIEKYLLPFEITGFLLLIAVVGAIFLARLDTPVRGKGLGRHAQTGERKE
ncbi:NADH-quinone oxidoreductase subunit J [uncultured Thermanaerothrix sp.]|uniref:NADH-quinone oxidoreductase subunit J family protein n=1 Tax=uncultured Thermanaerothrix sp. TaxID=1195149 RepID=UPI00263156FC|nr:NADH-quinone oxidoreductase subunit J [uncultured Thermanaerothrix sp.]